MIKKKKKKKKKKGTKHARKKKGENTGSQCFNRTILGLTFFGGFFEPLFPIPFLSPHIPFLPFLPPPFLSPHISLQSPYSFPSFLSKRNEGVFSSFSFSFSFLFWWCCCCWEVVELFALSCCSEVGGTCEN